jgi:hypothetical protein
MKSRDSAGLTSAVGPTVVDLNSGFKDVRTDAEKDRILLWVILPSYWLTIG